MTPLDVVSHLQLLAVRKMNEKQQLPQKFFRHLKVSLHDCICLLQKLAVALNAILNLEHSFADL